MGLKGDIRRGLSSVSSAASAASMSVATLAELDLAKSRMEAACSHSPGVSPYTAAQQVQCRHHLRQ